MHIKKLGILGGMGPQATIDLFQKIVSSSPAKSDQEHIPLVIYNYPQIPDRTKSILGKDSSSFPKLLEGVLFLENSGCDAILIPCNTAHYYIQELQERTSIKIFNMVELTVDFIKSNYPDVKILGLLATTGTIITKIYDYSCKLNGFELIKPDSNGQNSVMDAIYGAEGVKAGNFENSTVLLSAESENLVNEGAELIIAGCTEIPLALKNSSVPIIDPTQILAEYAIQYAYSDYEVIYEVENENRYSLRI